MSIPTFDQLFPIFQRSASKWVPNKPDGSYGFTLDDENEEAIRYALQWACAHPKFDGDPGKGLLLMGQKGSGKTLLMRSLSASIDPSLRFETHNTRKVTSAYNCNGDKGLEPYLIKRHMMFDDLGDERKGQHYGDRVEVMSLIIQERYELFIDHGIQTHFTTNLSPKEIEDRYGERSYSRLRHQVNLKRVGPSENAKDRREDAVAPPRQVLKIEPEFVPASPEVAAEGFRRVHEVIREAAKELRDLPPGNPMRVVATSQELDTEAFRKGIRGKSVAQLTEARKLIEMRNTEGAAAPFLEAIDAELKRLDPIAEAGQDVVQLMHNR